MHTIRQLKNIIQPYAWGSRTALAELLDKPNLSAEPQAELWMGAHPKAPSRVMNQEDSEVRLDELIAAHPADILGSDIARRFDNRLPYLFKVLAAAEPLSVQAHPDREQARRGFERENRADIPLDAPYRNYRDANHKPECICALTPYWALCGFRPIDHILSLFNAILPSGLVSPIAALDQQRNRDGLKSFFSSLLTCPDEKQAVIIDEAVAKAGPLAGEKKEFQWLLKLVDAYGHDMGVFAPLLLNLVCLQPGQALYLGAGELHAYLEGMGIELMANSDNVLRGGLTPKHVDVPELVRTLTFEEKDLEILEATGVRDHEKQYRTPAEEFVLSVISTNASDRYASSSNRSVEILLCVDGQATISAPRQSQSVTFKKGDTFLVPAAAGPYTIAGPTTVYKAAVP
jgi:mannose-6-phosphate isomerase